MTAPHAMQGPREAAPVDEPAEHPQEAPGSPQRERHREHQQGRHRGAGAAAEEGRGERQRQHVAGRGHRGALPERVPGLDVQAPPVTRRRGHRRQRASRHRAERLPRPDQRQQHEQRDRERHRAGEEADEQPALLGEHRLVVVLVHHPGWSGARLGELDGPAALGDVGSLVGGRRGQVADEVQAVPVRQPPRRQQVLDLLVVDRPSRYDGYAGRPAARADSSRRTPARRARRGTARPGGPGGSRACAAACRTPGARPGTAATGRASWPAACRARRGVPGSACAGR